MMLKKGDLVEVITGEEKGRRGKILEIIKDKKRNLIRAVVEGVNLVKKHKRTVRADRPGGIIEIPSPISISNLGLLCPKCGKITKIRREKIEGKRKRICKLCQEIID
ncbi:MAG: 50S ribosomal protein L24 [candidate division WOR-3 bacterium]|nr:50S ribosomal protein L24 [candidate division WOR-3 bacterium]MDW7987174.1 50S ribosomal protein L24 [candidate division WOR-3 bacterium]